MMTHPPRGAPALAFADAIFRPVRAAPDPEPRGRRSQRPIHRSPDGALPVVDRTARRSTRRRGLESLDRRRRPDRRAAGPGDRRPHDRHGRPSRLPPFQRAPGLDSRRPRTRAHPFRPRPRVPAPASLPQGRSAGDAGDPGGVGSRGGRPCGDRHDRRRRGGCRGLVGERQDRDGARLDGAWGVVPVRQMDAAQPRWGGIGLPDLDRHPPLGASLPADPAFVADQAGASAVRSS